MSSARLSAFFIFSAFCLFFVSCSNGSTGIAVISTDTLKSETEEKNNYLNWTRELESTRLAVDISKQPGLNKELKVNAKNYPLIQNVLQPVYPKIEDFGSLDISSISSEMKDKLDSFCRCISEQTAADAFIEKTSLFTLVLFNADFNSGWKENFGEDLPKASADEPLFTSWIFGEPFTDEDSMQIPVRFYGKTGTVDIFIFTGIGDSALINQIQIKKWEKSDGK